MKKVTLVDETYKNLKKDFLSGVIEPGDKLIIRELAERYEVSQTPIKQALNRLVAEDFVEALPGKGMRRKKFNSEDIEDMLDARIMIETFIASKVINNLDFNVDYLDKLAKNIEEHEKIIIEYETEGDYMEISHLDGRFHELYVEASGNLVIIQLYKNLQTHSYAQFTYKKKSKERLLMGVEEHKAMYRALCERNIDELKQKITEHFGNAKETLRAIARIEKQKHGD
ncbi:MAG: GntR family transcriptional regulator [Eubacterium sp.]